MANVLIMEDDLQTALRLCDTLHNHGYNTLMTRNAAEAKEALLNQQFDIVITDIFVSMHGRPVPDGGISLIGWIRAKGLSARDKDFKHLPIIAISSASKNPTKSHALKVATSVGATSCVTKPFTEDEIVSEVAWHLEAKAI